MAECWAQTMVVKKVALSDLRKVRLRHVKRAHLMTVNWVDLMVG